jgi:hypothetical protein
MSVPVPDKLLWRRVAALEQQVSQLDAELKRVTGSRSILTLASRTWRFRLNESFSDGEADADLLDLDGNDTNMDVVVKDPLLIFQTLGVTTDDEGYAEEQIDLDGTRWFLVIQMECP